ncbi:MAG: hypothetical protein ACRENC_09545, partial [Gemmatimonadaceae bacterium]
EQVTMETMWVKRYDASMLYGSVQTSNGDPVADIEVSLTPATDSTPPIANAPVKTDVRGAFVLHGWLGERYIVTAGRPAAPSGQVEVTAGSGPLIVIVPR